MYQTIKGEDIRKENLAVLIYGDEGTGKTSISLTSSKPLLIDFDGGTIRSEVKAGKEIIPITSWSDIRNNGGAESFKKQFVDFDTIIFDTVGFCQNYVLDYLQSKQTYKNNMQLYGDLLSELKPFIASFLNWGKNIVFLAHSEVKEKNKMGKTVPQIAGQLKSFIAAKCDLIFYLYSGAKGEKCISFNSNDFVDLKNPAHLQDGILPDFKQPENKNYLQNIINQTKEFMNGSIEKQANAIKQYEAFKTAIESIGNIAELNNFMASLKGKTMTKALKAQVQKLFDDAAKRLNAEFHKEEKRYYAKEPATLSETIGDSEEEFL